MKPYRYPGSQPFSTDQKDLFFGRKEDVVALYEQISLQQVLVLFSQSGLGKSSLINAGLLPRLEQDPQFETRLIRFGAFSASQEEVSPLEILLGNQEAQAPLLANILPKENSLWYQLKDQQFQQGSDKTLLLIFDQFEELFSYPQQAVDILAGQLAEVLYQTIPQRFRQFIESKLQENPNAFLPEDWKTLHQPLSVKLLFVIRADQISQLNQLSAFLPPILQNCYELQALTEEQAEDAIVLPALRQQEEFVSPAFDFSDEALEKILSYLTRDRTEKIESFQLQILCQAIERNVIKHNLSLIEADDIGEADKIYKNYYDDQIAELSGKEDQLSARRLIEEGLILEEEGRRLSLYEGQIIRDFGVSRDLLTQLVDTHLIRAESSLKGGFMYELCHDSLVAPILRAKQKRQQEERDLQAQAELAKMKKKRSRARLIAISGYALFFMALLASGIAYLQYTQASRAKESAESARQDAEEANRKTQTAYDSLNQTIERTNRLTYQNYLNLGRVSMSEGNYREALEHLNTARSFNPDTSNRQIDSLLQISQRNLGGKGQFDSYISQGRAAERSGNYLQALAAYSSARNLSLNRASNSQADLRLAGIKSKVQPEIKEKLRNANTFISRNDCDVGLVWLRQLEDYRQYGMMESGDVLEWNRLMNACR